MSLLGCTIDVMCTQVTKGRSRPKHLARSTDLLIKCLPEGPPSFEVVRWAKGPIQPFRDVQPSWHSVYCSFVPVTLLASLRPGTCKPDRVRTGSYLCGDQLYTKYAPHACMFQSLLTSCQHCPHHTHLFEPVVTGCCFSWLNFCHRCCYSSQTWLGHLHSLNASMTLFLHLQCIITVFFMKLE